MGISLQGKEHFPYFAGLTTNLTNPTAQDLHIWSQCHSAALLHTPLHTATEAPCAGHTVPFYHKTPVTCHVSRTTHPTGKSRCPQLALKSPWKAFRNIKFQDSV